jgi:hypothetical protein
MIPLVGAITANLALIIVSLYSWKRYKDKNFIYIALAGLATLSIVVLSYRGIVPFRYWLLSFSLSTALINWYDWKKFKDKHFFRHMLICIAWFLLLVYAIYFTDVKLSLPIQDWPISSYVILIGLVGILVAYIML